MSLLFSWGSWGRDTLDVGCPSTIGSGGGLLTEVCNSLNAPTEVVKQIIINIEAGVEVEVTIAA